MNAHDLRRTHADDEDLLACLVGDLADEVLEAAAGAAAAQLGTWVNCTPIWWCPGVSGETKPPRIGPVGEDSRNELLAASRVMVGGTR